MDKRVVLAVAGSGKTYYICNNIDETKRNIIIAYTNQNIKNILNELKERYGYIPQNTLVMTFHSFVYNYMIRPFDNLIGEYYGRNDFISNGVSIISPPQSSIKLKNGKRRKNPKYNKVDTLEHYIIDRKYYSDYLSKLVLKTKNKEISIVNIACDNINKFFDNIYIDEMQDFREENWLLLVEIIKKVNNILLVGDYNQHSVSAINNHGFPFQNKKEYISYNDYIDYLKTLGLIVDETSLLKSRRCSKEVCQFISNKLNINIESNEDNVGKIIWISNLNDVLKILDNNEIIKLVWEQPETYDFNSISWSYSKGDTYNDICIILTDTYFDLDQDNFKYPSSIISINKLYVALTRSRGNVYIIKKTDFELAYKNMK